MAEIVRFAISPCADHPRQRWRRYLRHRPLLHDRRRQTRQPQNYVRPIDRLGAIDVGDLRNPLPAKIDAMMREQALNVGDLRLRHLDCDNGTAATHPTAEI